MPHAIILTTAHVIAASGGTFADTAVVNTGDSLSVASYDSGGARIIEAWAIDSDSAAEGEWIYTRPDSTHDQQNGFKFGIPALSGGGAANNAGFNVLPGGLEIPVFLNDAATIKFSCTASDDIVISYLTEYDDLPGVGAVQFASWDQIKALRKSNLGLQCTAVAGTVGLYGADRAINADDTRMHANTYYAILGVSVQTVVTTIKLRGPAWGGQGIGIPAGTPFANSNMWFVDQTLKRQRPFIPFFHSADAGNVLVNVVDGEASTSPHIDFNMVELTSKPGV